MNAAIDRPKGRPQTSSTRSRVWGDRLPNDNALTLRMLLRHQSGLLDPIRGESFQPSMQERMEAQGRTPMISKRFFASCATRSRFSRGGGFSYSDRRYIRASLVVGCNVDDEPFGPSSKVTPNGDLPYNPGTDWTRGRPVTRPEDPV